MKRFALAVAFAAALFLTTSYALVKRQCFNATDVYMANLMAMRPFAGIGIAGRHVFVLYAGRGGWTLLYMPAPKVACILIDGQEWSWAVENAV